MNVSYNWVAVIYDLFFDLFLHLEPPRLSDQGGGRNVREGEADQTHFANVPLYAYVLQSTL